MINYGEYTRFLGNAILELTSKAGLREPLRGTMSVELTTTEAATATRTRNRLYESALPRTGIRIAPLDATSASTSSDFGACMHRKFLAVVATALLVGPLTAVAVPVHYGVTFSAISGPSGTGSLSFDADIGVITDFFWDFAGITGGFDDTFGTTTVFGGTFGQFVFEILSQTDVHPEPCSTSIGCTVYGPMTSGTGALGAPYVRFEQTASGPAYRFSTDFQGTQAVAWGTIGVATIPEPSTITLLGGAILLFGFLYRRTRA